MKKALTSAWSWVMHLHLTELLGFFHGDALHVGLVGFAVFLLLLAGGFFAGKRWGKGALALVVAIGLLGYEVQTVMALGAACWAMLLALW